MADHVISLTEQINVFGLAPSTKWNEFTWGSGKWGEGTNGLFKEVGKFLTETQASTDSITRASSKYISDTQSVTMVETDTKLGDGSGYSYVFPGGATDAEEQVITDFTRQSAGSTSWTKQSDGNTSWS